MPPTIPSLDTPTRLDHRARVVAGVGVALYAVVVAVAYVLAPRALQPVPAVAVAHALTTFAVAGVTALVLLSHAEASGHRGHAILGATFLYVSALMLVLPLLFPGAIDAAGPVFGGPQSSVAVYFAWHYVLLAGITLSALVLAHDERTHRRPRPGGGAPAAAALALVAAAVTVVTATLGADHLPTLVRSGGAMAALGLALDRGLVVAAAFAVAVMLRLARGGSTILRWIAAIGLLLLGEAIVNLNSPARYSAGWYYSRLMGLAAFTTLLVVLVWNLTRIGRANSQMATTDLLTGLESRAGIMRSLAFELGRALQEHTHVTVLWIDLDGFKSVNDQMGHAQGDVVLRVVSERLRAQVRAADHVARVGGDEFCVLLCDDAAVQRADRVAHRLLDALREPITVDNGTYLVTGSVGIAVAPDDAVDAEDLLTRADLAMYAAKATGGDRAHRFDTSLGLEAVARAQMRQNLATAIRRRRFDLDYQPVVEVAGGRAAGAEALLRWLDGDLRVPAGDFIGVAQSTGQAIALGHMVVDSLERDLPRLLTVVAPDFFVSVNLSATELADSTLVARLMAGPVHDHASQVVVEVTESLELHDGSDAVHNLQKLRRAGYRIAIDDFGAGFSSFTRLERLEPAVIKVDRSLVARAGEGSDGGIAFLRAACSVARSLGCEVVAGGVETEAEAEVVRLLGIRWAQGYRYAQPMQLADLLSPHAMDAATRAQPAAAPVPQAPAP